MERCVHASIAFALAAALSLAPSSGAAQTRLTLFAGPLVPFGDFADVASLSWTAGVRAEYQTVNAIGERSRMAYFIEGSYSEILVNEDYEQLLNSLEQDNDASLVGGAAGVRVYSRPAPLFLSAAAGYLRYIPAGDAEEANGLDLQLGLGFLIPFDWIQLEAVAVAHEVLLDSEESFGEEDLQFLTATAGFAIPF